MAAAGWSPVRRWRSEWAPISSPPGWRGREWNGKASWWESLFLIHVKQYNRHYKVGRSGRSGRKGRECGRGGFISSFTDIADVDIHTAIGLGSFVFAHAQFSSRDHGAIHTHPYQSFRFGENKVFTHPTSAAAVFKYPFESGAEGDGREKEGRASAVSSTM